MKKIIVITIIGLFLGLATIPSINAEIKEDEYPNNIQLSETEIAEIEQIMDNLRKDVEAVESDEVIDLYLDAIDELYHYGVLGHTPKQFIKIYMKMLNAVYSKIADSSYFKEILKENDSRIDNVACSVVGTGGFNSFKRRGIFYFQRFYFPIKINVFITAGFYHSDYYSGYARFPSWGNITTNGDMGIVSWDSSNLYGQLFKIIKISPLGGAFYQYREYYTCISRFSGLIIQSTEYIKGLNYIGWALFAGIDETPPEI